MKDACEVKFNAPAASHAGGVWERHIRSVRRVMAALLSTVWSQLDDECLNTCLCEAAAIINSRPLSVDNLADPDNYMPISPSNFLTMKPSIVMSPPGNFTKDDIYSRKRWRRVQYLSNQLWLKCRSEYLQNIQLRKKWTKPRTNLQVGDFMLLKDDNLPRCDWHLCRVLEVYKSKDNKVRSAKLLVGSRDGAPGSVLNRPIQNMVFVLAGE